MRYSDDIFFIWKGKDEKVKNFFNKINKSHPYIKFDQKYSKPQIYKDEQQRLQTTLFKKNTDRQSYLHAKYDHPVSLKKVYRSVKYCESKESVQQTANSSAIVQYCKDNLQKVVMTLLRLKPKLRTLNFQIRKIR